MILTWMKILIRRGGKITSLLRAGKINLCVSKIGRGKMEKLIAESHEDECFLCNKLIKKEQFA